MQLLHDVGFSYELDNKHEVFKGLIHLSEDGEEN